MAKVKLTKNALKAQRDALKRFSRYLPTLQLKKQQLTLETRRVRDDVARLEEEQAEFARQLDVWIGLLDESTAQLAEGATAVEAWETTQRNIAGVETPVFGGVRLTRPRPDLFATPLLLDDVLDAVRRETELRLRHQLLQEQLDALEAELRTTAQRVNLFEKVKIPEAKEHIRRIQIYLGDERTNAVGRAKIAKGKVRALEEAM
ncbi:MAG: V-type ATP synthase subunit D [Lentisphaerae bacterium ADurb.BinA184]|nr:MAG: V-type ATP synthase subunit D [Lentisphaerae bacterium ADurb.BinA184]